MHYLRWLPYALPLLGNSKRWVFNYSPSGLPTAAYPPSCQPPSTNLPNLLQHLLPSRWHMKRSSVANLRISSSHSLSYLTNTFCIQAPMHFSFLLPTSLCCMAMELDRTRYRFEFLSGVFSSSCLPTCSWGVVQSTSYKKLWDLPLSEIILTALLTVSYFRHVSNPPTQDSFSLLRWWICCHRCILSSRFPKIVSFQQVEICVVIGTYSHSHGNKSAYIPARCRIRCK